MKITTKSGLNAQDGLLIGNIPEELKDDAPVWCGYKLKPNPDPTKKPKKLPINPDTGRLAMINDPETFVIYDKVARAFQALECDGINRAFGYDDYVGIDLDHVRGVETEDITCDKAAEIIHRFIDAGAYVEVSPSGTGVRIICRGTFSRFGKGVGGYSGFEVYGKGPGGLHFLSITGNVVQRVDVIPTCQTELDWLYETYFKKPVAAQEGCSHSLEDSPWREDDEIIEAARRSRVSGAEFSALFDEGPGGKNHSEADWRFINITLYHTQNAEQIDRIFRQSRLYRKEPLKDSDYSTRSIKNALKTYTGARWQPRQHEEATQYGVTESEVARRFKDSDKAEGFKVQRATRHPQVMRYEGGVWMLDHHGHELKKSIQTMAKELRLEGAHEADAGRRNQLFKAADRLESKRGLDDVATLVLMKLNEFKSEAANARDDLFCLDNGVVSLPNGKLLHHWPGYNFTLKSPAIFDPEAGCPLWLKFVDEFCCGDKDLARFLQSWFGYCLSGYTTEQKMTVFFGFGANGKSVLLETMKYVMGGFGAQTPADSLLQRQNEQTNDLAALIYKRFVVAAESDEGKALAEARVKAMTGGDEIVCRKLFEEFQSFTPKFKLNLATNSKPRVIGADHGVWRRLLLIPCRSAVSNPDKHLLEKLRAEASGILNWLIEGFQDWKAKGLEIPECIRVATSDYKRLQAGMRYGRSIHRGKM